MNSTSSSWTDALYNPASVAVIGASRDETSVGTTILINILSGGYKGSVFPVNPNAEVIQGKKAYPSVGDVPSPVDLAIIVVPSAIVPLVLKEAGEKGVKSAIIISSGFGETGPEGKKRERELITLSKQYGTRILGPNCLGIINPYGNLNASFARTPAHRGSIAFLSQSGAIGAAMLDFLYQRNVGLSHFISMGNEADVSVLSLLPSITNDEKTSVVGIYMEQIPEANTFLNLIRNMRSKQTIKPIVVLKAGKTKEGSLAAKSHTGALTGSDNAGKTLFRQAGVIETRTIEEFITTLTAFSANPPMKQKNLAIITNAGGPGIMAVDTASIEGLTLVKEGVYDNPYDLLGDASAEAYDEALHTVSSDPNVGAIMTIITPQTTTNIEKTAQTIIDARKTISQPLVVSSMGESAMKPATDMMQKAGIAVTLYPEIAVQALSNMWKWQTYAHQTQEPAPVFDDIDTESAKKIVREAAAAQKSLTPKELFRLLSLYGIPTPPHIFAKTKEELTEKIDRLSDTLVLKIMSPDIVHKTDVGAIALNVKKSSALQTYERLLDAVKKTRPYAHIEGVLCMDFMDTSNGLEMIIGVKEEKEVGNLIMAGAGGTMVELVRDVSFRFAPINSGEAKDMIDELKIAPLFSGFRGKNPFDKKALIDILCRMSKMVMDIPEISELDLNPILVLPKGNGAFVLDVRIALS